MILRCIVCTGDIPEKRLDRNADTCSQGCANVVKKIKRERARRLLKGKTCPTCSRYVPRNGTEIALAQGVRVWQEPFYGNAARFA